MTWFLQWLASFLSGPIIKSVLDGYRAKLAAGNTSEKIAADVAQRELVVQQREVEVTSQLRIAEIGKWYEPDHLFSYTLLIYFAKIIVWDKVFGLGSTEPLSGDLHAWAASIILFLFGKRGIENVARILKRK